MRANESHETRPRTTRLARLQRVVGSGLGSMFPWMLLGWLYPLSHSWILEDGFLESPWASLHGVWCLSLGLSLALLSTNARWTVVASAAFGYLLTCGASRAVSSAVPAAVSGALIVQFALLAGFMFWASRRLGRATQSAGG